MISNYSVSVPAFIWFSCDQQLFCFCSCYFLVYLHVNFPPSFQRNLIRGYCVYTIWSVTETMRTIVLILTPYSFWTIQNYLKFHLYEIFSALLTSKSILHTNRCHGFLYWKHRRSFVLYACTRVNTLWLFHQIKNIYTSLMFMYTLQMKTVLGLNHTKGRVII